MNERIKELIKQAEYTVKGANGCIWGTNISIEKLAELIVNECIKVIGYKSADLLDIDFYPHYQERLKKHFGIEQ